MEDTKTAKEEFLELLRSTGREGVEGVIEDLEGKASSPHRRRLVTT